MTWQQQKSELIATSVQFLKRGGGWQTRLSALILIESVLLLLCNHWTHQYQGVRYIDPRMFLLFPAVLIILSLAYILRIDMPRTFGFFKGIWQLFVCSFCLMVFCTAIQYTPFPLIDETLLRIDRLLGFSSVQVVTWIYHHPSAQKFFKLAYSFLWVELPLTPLILGLLRDKNAQEKFFIAIYISVLIGFNIYYFFPSTVPAHVAPSPYYLSDPLRFVMQFMEIHQHKPMTVQIGALIDFPSFHVIWGSLCVCAFYRYRLIFYPLLIINIFLVLSTLALGWHFLLDVIAGFIIAAIAIWAANRLNHCHFNQTGSRRPAAGW